MYNQTRLHRLQQMEMCSDLYEDKGSRVICITEYGETRALKIPEPRPSGWAEMACAMTCTVISLTTALSACLSTATNGRSASSCGTQT